MTYGQNYHNETQLAMHPTNVGMRICAKPVDTRDNAGNQGQQRNPP